MVTSTILLTSLYWKGFALVVLCSIGASVLGTIAILALFYSRK